MKKALLYSLSLALILSLTACNNQGDTSGITGDMENNGSASSEQAGTTSSGPSETRGTGDNVDVQTGDISTGIVVSGIQAEQTGQTGQTGEKVNGEIGEQTGEGEKAPEEVEEPFTEVNETVYATSQVNLRSSYSTQSDKVGNLTKGQQATRIGIGTGEADGWSKIQLSDGSIVYVSSKYLSTTKPASSNGNTSKPATPPSKPATPPTPPKPSQSGGDGGSEEEDSRSSFEQRIQEAEKNLEGAKGKVDPNAPTDKDGNPIGSKY